MLLLILIAIVFLLASGVMAAIDAAVLSVTHPEIEEMIQQGRWGAVQVRTIRHNLARAVVVVVIITNTINVLGPILVSQQAFEEFGPGALGAITIGLTVGTILFSEIIPKALGTHYAPLISRVAAPGLIAVSYVLYPLVLLLAWLSEQFTRGHRPIGTEQQIRALVMMGRRGGHIETDEVKLIYRTFHLNDRTAREIMTPAGDVVMMSSTNSLKDAAERVRENQYSRYPVIDETTGKVLGLVRSRDILEGLVDGRGADSVASITQPGLQVGADEPANELLLKFRDRHVHLAAVIDNEQFRGIVTLEDVLEELVGQIDDEKDVRRQALQ